MKKMPVPAILLVLLAALFAASIILAAWQLPARVAVHFGRDGVPNGWMGLRQHLLILGGIGTLLPAIIIGAFYSLRFSSGRFLNLPNRGHWLAPERREATFAWLFRWALWFGCLWLAFFTVIGLLILRANLVQPRQLAPGPSLALGAGFTACIVLWAFCMLVHFLRRR